MPDPNSFLRGTNLKVHLDKWADKYFEENPVLEMPQDG